MNLSQILQELQPLLITGVSALLSLLIGLAANTARAKFGLDIEARHREALHSALISGLQAAMKKGPQAGLDALTDEAIQYAKNSVPDAIAKLAPSGETLRDLARSKLAALGFAP